MKVIQHLILTIHIIVSLTYPKQHQASIHQEQLKKFKNKPSPVTDKVKVKTGLDILLDERINILKNKSIALVTNHTGIDHSGIPNYKRLMEINGVKIKVIFSPEHGLFGEASAGEKISYNKIETDLPKIISLYGKIRKPTNEMLSGVDIIIYDIQDIGSRFYTYITTLGLVMEAAGERKIPVLVLDRPNPIRGDIIDGPILDINFRTFVGYYPIPIRYGGTIGDLAQKIIIEKWISPIPKLTVIPLKGWEKNYWFDETDLIWVAPSPNIPDLETAIIYPGMCLIEGTNISEGRGTPSPFKWVGAPWIDGIDLSQKLNKLDLPGVVFIPKSFVPISIPGKSENPKHKEKKCGGVEIQITNRNIYNSVKSGVIMLFTLYELNKEKIKFHEKHLNRLWGNDNLLNSIRSGQTVNNFLLGL